MAAVRVEAIAALLVVTLAALALSSSTASALQLFSRRPSKPRPPKQVSTPGDPKKAPRNGKLRTVVTNRFHKRDYEVACYTDWGADCYIKCPDRCPNKCIAYCAYCITFCMCDLMPSTSCGDPRFTGADGNTFYFHGKKDESFCVVSDAGLHVNARFMGNHNAGSGRDFTWVKALGVTFGSDGGGDTHRLYVGARRAAEWDEDEDHVAVVLDGEPVDVEPARDARWVSTAVPGLTVTRTDAANAVVVELDGAFAITANAVPITDEDSRVHAYGKTAADSLVHLDISYQFHALTDHVDGVLGQTYRPDYVNKLDISAKMPVMGGADKYRSSGLFATDCAVSRFHRVGDGAGGGGADAGFTSFAS